MTSNLHPVMAQALRAWMPLSAQLSDPRESLQLEADDTDTEDDADEEAGICPTCSGSGEGMYEGTRCRSCNGRGEI